MDAFYQRMTPESTSRYFQFMIPAKTGKNFLLPDLILDNPRIGCYYPVDKLVVDFSGLTIFATQLPKGSCVAFCLYKIQASQKYYIIGRI